MHTSEDLIDYAYDEEVGRDLKAFLVIKGFKQSAIVEKIIRRKGQRDFGLTAVSDAAERRYSEGLIVAVDLKAEEFTADILTEAAYRLTCLEPFDLALRGGTLAYTAGYEVRLLDLGSEREKVFSNGWLSFAHTVEFSADGSRLLVSSAGFDSLLEMDAATGETTWEWNSWDHGFNESKVGGFFVTRDPAQAEEIGRAGREVILVADPAAWPREGIPTHMSPTRVNGASYAPDGRILTTFFHGSELLLIQRDGSFSTVDLGLSHPHGFRRAEPTFHEGYLVVNTGAGEFLFLDEGFRPVAGLAFSSLPADEAKRRGFGEWIQNACVLDARRGILAAVDALRDGVHLIDRVNRRRRFIPNPPAWTVQTLVPA